MSGKYVVGKVTDGLFTGEIAILFPDHIAHKTIASIVFKNDCTSAGFFSVNGDEVRVWGESVSIGVKSKESDVGLVKASLGKDHW